MRKGGREVKRRLKEEWATYCKMHAHCTCAGQCPGAVVPCQEHLGTPLKQYQ